MFHSRGNKLTWLDHAAFRLTTPSGKVIVVDPSVRTNPMCPESLKKFVRRRTMLITRMGSSITLPEKQRRPSGYWELAM